MTLIEGIGDEVVQFFVGLFFVLIVVLAWWTTNTTNDGTFRTVFLLERRRLRSVRRLITHTESSTIAEGTSQENSEPNQSNATMEEVNKPTSSAASETAGEETRIVEAMDAPNCLENEGLRRRRNAEDGDIPSDQDEQDGSGPVCSASDVKPSSSNPEEENKNDRICVKLKYITDELRQVDGSLNENIGDFKRRHFEVELAANKVVKLIFNGQILQKDSDTLQTCGLFDNCVVHCVFIPCSNTSQGPSASSTENGSSFHSSEAIPNAHNQPHEWHLENYLLAILCCFLGAAWYLRYVYSQLYTVTATIGLILMTGIFTIIMFGMHFPDNIELNQRTENVGTPQ